MSNVMRIRASFLELISTWPTLQSFKQISHRASGIYRSKTGELESSCIFQ